jgi:hypothetical protein
MLIQSYQDLDLYFTKFQWSEPRKDQEPLFLIGADFQAQFLYFNGHTPEKRQALAKCIEAYNTHFGEHLTWGGYYDKDGEGHYSDLNDPKMPTIHQVLELWTHPSDQIEWSCASGDREEAPEYRISAMTNRQWESELLKASQIRFSVPNELIFDPKKRQILLDLFQLFIDKLGVYHAVAGLQSIVPYRPNGVGDYSLLQGKRFWGIYQGANTDERHEIANGIKSIDWLTYLSNTLVQRICPVDTFVKTYCPHFDIKPQQQQHGMLFQLEEYPQILPSNEPVLPSYYNLNRALRPLRNGIYGGVSMDEGQGYAVLDTSATRQWIRRLDAPDIFPDQGHYEERPPKKKVYLKSGKICELDGVYRYDEQIDTRGEPVTANDNGYEVDSVSDYRQHVVLLKGDLAPNFLEFNKKAEFVGTKKIKWHLVSELVRRKKDDE